ncbi:E4 SUMO-protein ligase PIAL2-like isoform X2 [Rutidosis leptorrhynchoides]
MHCQFLEIIRSLLECFSSAGQRDAIVEVFYERHLDQLISVIVASCLPNDVTCVGHTSKSSDGIQATAKPEILLNICDLLCKHPQCFDYDYFMEVNSSRPIWKCPLCKKPVCNLDIRIDQDFLKILNEAANNVSHVIFMVY